MAETFEELGLRPELVAAAAEADYRAPTAVQRAAIPVLRRGGNAVVQASSGAGVTAAYGLAVLDRLAEGAADSGLRCLVLAPTDDAARRTAGSLAAFARAAGLRAAALDDAWAWQEPAPHLLVATPAAALRAVQRSRLKLEGVQALVVQDAAAMLAEPAADAVESLTASVPREAQRIVTAAEPTRAVDDFVERHVRRALTIPGRTAEPAAAREPVATVAYAVVPGALKLDVAAAWLVRTAAEAPAVVYCRTAPRSADVAAALEVRGLRRRDGAAGDFETAAAGAAVPEQHEGRTALSLDVPFDAASLLGRHAAGGLVLVEPRELPHLRRIAAEAAVALEPAPEPRPKADAGVDAFHDQLRTALRNEDLGAYLLVIEPLLQEHSAAEIAAAASAMLRRRVAAEAPPQQPVARPAPAGAPAPRAWVRLFVSAGARDNIRPGDLVGAITGEAAVSGEELGRIEIRDTFSIVEVASGAAQRIIQAMNGITLRGRSLRVDYDRKTPAPPGRRGRD